MPTFKPKGAKDLFETVPAAEANRRFSELLRGVREEGKTVPDELLAHVSPLGWEHIGLTGDYLWREDLVPLSGTYRELGR